MNDDTQGMIGHEWDCPGDSSARDSMMSTPGERPRFVLRMASDSRCA